MGRAVKPLVRSRLEVAIQELVDLLDDIDGDPDMEGEESDDQADDEPAHGGYPRKRKRADLSFVMAEINRRARTKH
jgi:hypothetical protein